MEKDKAQSTVAAYLVSRAFTAMSEDIEDAILMVELNLEERDLPVDSLDIKEMERIHTEFIKAANEGKMVEAFKLYRQIIELPEFADLELVDGTVH